MLNIASSHYVLQEQAEDEDATTNSLDIPPDMLNDAEGMLGSVYNEPSAAYNQATFPPFTDIEFSDLASQGWFDDPEIPLQVCT